MLSTNKIKLIQSLSKKKYRQKYNLFVVEGIKNIKEFVFSDFILKNIYSTEPISFLNESQYELISQDELKKISFLTTPHNALALFEIPIFNLNKIVGMQLALDEVQDPGNMGTIIRLADWFGIEQIVCSPGTVDIFNPKVVQASMGSLTRVNIVYMDLVNFITSNEDLRIYATDMNGDNLYETSFASDAVLVMGNEGNGISDQVKQLCTNVITIPRFGNIQKTESLNVAMSAGIIIGEFFSQINKNGNS
ncbi:RNA methyltransferase [Apibacter sp. HY039]|uniref:RNA methyltransferase n=1 Tax=Apibacter sp. HY039 TaxID=2501476 RepID=UPI000FEBC18D|nr:RNA methyltransferase [Apibacter sp. HY039]